MLAADQISKSETALRKVVMSSYRPEYDQSISSVSLLRPWISGSASTAIRERERSSAYCISKNKHTCFYVTYSTSDFSSFTVLSYRLISFRHMETYSCCRFIHRNVPFFHFLRGKKKMGGRLMTEWTVCHSLRPTCDSCYCSVILYIHHNQLRQ